MCSEMSGQRLQKSNHLGQDTRQHVFYPILERRKRKDSMSKADVSVNTSQSLLSLLALISIPWQVEGEKRVIKMLISIFPLKHSFIRNILVIEIYWIIELPGLHSKPLMLAMTHDQECMHFKSMREKHIQRTEQPSTHAMVLGHQFATVLHKYKWANPKH